MMRMRTGRYVRGGEMVIAGNCGEGEGEGEREIVGGR